MLSTLHFFAFTMIFFRKQRKIYFYENLFINDTLFFVLESNKHMPAKKIDTPPGT